MCPAAASAAGDLVDVLARDAVDDAGLAAVRGQHCFELLLARQARPDAIDQVRAIEVADQHQRVAQPELPHDVLAHPLVAVAVKACIEACGQAARSAAELPVLRPEIVAPVADAVRLVDGDVADAAPRERRWKPAPPSPIRRSGET